MHARSTTTSLRPILAAAALLAANAPLLAQSTSTAAPTSLPQSPAPDSPAPDSRAHLREFLLEGELLLFPQAEIALSEGWSLGVLGVDAAESISSHLQGRAELVREAGQPVAFGSSRMATGAGQFVLAGPAGEQLGLGDLSLVLYDGEWTLLAHSGDLAGRPVFVLASKDGAWLERGEDFAVTGELLFAPSLALELGLTLDARTPVGALTLLGSAMFDPARPLTARAPAAAGALIGPDVVVSTIGSTFGEYGAVGDIGGYAVTTVSCNVGDQEAIWIDSGAQPNRHPVIGTQLYRFKTVNGATRFEQIGMSWLKHGFCAADAPSCTSINPNGISNPTYAGNGSCDWLGLFATDTYSDGLNASQPGCGPRSEIQPWTGAYPFPYQLGAGASGNAIYKRLQVHKNELDPAQNVGATYWGEVVYICTDEPAANRYNNYSIRSTTVGTFASGQYGLNFAGSTIPLKSAVMHWATIDPGVTVRSVDVAGDGRLYLAYKTTQLTNGQHHYEYALFNMNSDRGAQAISIPLQAGTVPTNIGFKDVDYHSGEPYSATDWSATVTPGTSIAWSTQTHAQNANANALRWSTTYNYRFDAIAAPVQGTITVTLFKPGTPTTVTFLADVPGTGCGSFVYCTTSSTTLGCAPQMSGTGSASATASSGFQITCSSLEGGRTGLVFFGIGQTSLAWALGSTSTLCVTTPVQRTAPSQSGGTVGQCNGSISIDWNAWRAANPGGLGSPYTAGEMFYAQTWFRDPPAPAGTNLSNGLGFTLCP
ncbi:MAG: hypothetical protein FJ294_06520 [Planctomycetes bacterium]|nr:hypothetical protein [Planctomycetota bacterium]